MKITLLLAANLCALIIVLYFMDYFGVTNLYSKMKHKVVEEIQFDFDTTSKELTLIEEEEKNKLIESFNVRETELKKWESSLKENEEYLKTKELKLKQERKQLKEQKKKLEKEKEKKEIYDSKINNLAIKFFNMPPEKSVERILALKDDLLILDVLKSMDEYAADRGQSSIVPFLFSLMPAEDSGRLDRKYTLR